MRLALAALVTALAAFVLSVLAPLRQLTGDTVPGRIGGAVLRCAGDFDLDRVDWVRTQTQTGYDFYYTQLDRAGVRSSVFGPAPAVVVSLALLDFGEGDRISDDTLRRRERGAGALLLALAAALVTLAAAARVAAWRAALVGLACTLSFAGAASLGQGVWQATTALPAFTGALAAFAWRDRFPRVALAVPALLLLAVMLRPTIAPLVLGLGIAWLVDVRAQHLRGARTWRSWLVAGIAALAVVAPLALWNAIHLGSPLPVGQWIANARTAEHVFSVGGAATGLVGLLVSPARGLLWFAPILMVAVVAAARTRTYRLVALAIVLQLIAMAAFFKWHGGLTYGPRLLAEATWVGIWLALGTELRVPRWLLATALAITIVVGQLGLWRFTLEQWELRRSPEAHPAAFWDVVDSPIPATFTTPPRGVRRGYDSPPTLGLICENGTLRSPTH